MRFSYYRILAGVARQAAIASAHIPSAKAAAEEARTTGLRSVASGGFTPWLSYLRTAQPASPNTSIAGAAFLSARALCTSGVPLSQAGPHGDEAAAAASSSASSSAPRQLVRGKAGSRQSRLPSLPAKPLPPPARGAKDKAPKVPGAKAAAASAAAKAGGQQPLPREARQQLDAQLSCMPYKGANGPRTVRVTGFYIGHPIPRATADAVVQALSSHPLSEGGVLAAAYPDHEHTTIILRHATAGAALPAAPVAAAPVAAAPVAAAPVAAAPVAPAPVAPAPVAPAPVAAAGPGLEAESRGAGDEELVAAVSIAAAPASSGGDVGEGGERLDVTAQPAAAAGADLDPDPEGGEGRGAQAGGCMAIMLLEYGGVAFFNMPEDMVLEALARVVAAALPAAKMAELQLPRRQGGRTDVEAWRQVAAEKMHKEEQLIVVDPAMFTGRGTSNKRRWIRKLDDSLHIWEWDSTNLESTARVISQSAAIRYYNQECEDMLERYETIMPLGYEPTDRPMDRLMFWRSKLPLRDLRFMVFKSSGIRVRLYSRLGLREPPSSTWESARHHAVWDAMRHEFELDDRSDTLMEKTELLKQSCLDLISANNDSFTKRSELSIIILISMEIIISLTDLHNILGYDNVCRAINWVRGG